MSDQLTRSRLAAADFAASLSVRAAASPFGAFAGGDATFLESGLGASIQSLNRPQGMYHAAEQLKHFNGRVFTSIRPIAQAIAAQPLKVARRHPKGLGKVKFVQKMQAEWDHASQRSATDNLVEYAWRGHVARIKQHAPGFVKAHAEDLDVLDSHPILEALADPNPLQVTWQLWYVSVVHMLLTGRYYWWFVPVEDEGEYDIMAVPPSWVHPVHDQKGGRLFARYLIKPPNSMAAVADVAGEYIVPVGFPDPANPLGWFSPLQANARSVVSDESISESQYRTFRNSANPDLLITIGRHPDVAGVPGQKPVLTQEQRKQLMEWVRTNAMGVSKFGLPLICDALIDKVERLNKMPKEMDFQRSSDVTKSRIDQGFGTSPVMSGEAEMTTYAASSAAADHFYGLTVNPMLELQDQAMSKWVPPLYGEDDLLLFREPCRAENPDEKRADDTFLLGAGAVSINDLRAERGLPPNEGGDCAYMASTLQPVKVVRLGEEGSFPESITNPPPAAPGQVGQHPNQPAGPERKEPPPVPLGQPPVNGQVQANGQPPATPAAPVAGVNPNAKPPKGGKASAKPFRGLARLAASLGRGA